MVQCTFIQPLTTVSGIQFFRSVVGGLVFDAGGPEFQSRSGGSFSKCIASFCCELSCLLDLF